MAAQHVVGTVGTLWRYPVKSMLGESREEMLLTPNGSVGDRAWALRDVTSGRIASAKKFPVLLNFRAKYVEEPTPSDPGRVLIEAPDGRTLSPEASETSRRISDILGVEVRLENRPQPLERTSIVRETVFGDVPVEKFKPDWTRETMPDYFELKSGSFFEIGSVYVLSSGSVEHLRACQGSTAMIDQRRFRPNIYVQSETDAEGFVEDGWIGGTLKVGDSLVMGEFAETIWCVTSTLAQEDLPRDLSVLRTLAQHHKGCLGVYATVRSGGRIRIGDPVVLSN